MSIFRRDKASVDNLCHHCFNCSQINTCEYLKIRRFYILLLTILHIFFIKLISEHSNTNRRKAFFRFLLRLYLTLSVPENLKNSIFEMPIITQTLNIKNLRTISAKSINLHTIRKLIEYSLKNNDNCFLHF